MNGINMSEDGSSQRSESIYAEQISIEYNSGKNQLL
jgi:hypothetical protein